MPDRPDVLDPQTLPRVSVQGPVTAIERNHPTFPEVWHTYVSRFPAAASRLQLGDFTLFRLAPEEVRYVGGFGAARTLHGTVLTTAARSLDD